ncbi:MAG: hypothetical protein ISS79_06625 [Phycisphaerae bacterium]|nr:hypothetical protein [Phycisphaerae bacterium]
MSIAYRGNDWMLHRFGQLVLISCFLTSSLYGAKKADSQRTAIQIRAENFTVPPSTGPLTHILVRNTGDETSAVTVEPKFPDGWRWTPKHRTVTIEPHQVKRLPFTIEKAIDVESNRYAIEIAVRSDSDKTVHRQSVVCASAPYFKPKIDGRFKDWTDAIPVTFITAGKKTVVSTFWNKRYFCLYVQVEEDELNSYKKGATQIDAVQFALARHDAITGSAPLAKAQRCEFLVVDSAGMFAKDKCFSLIKPGEELSVTQQQRALETLELKEAEVVVKRKGSTTHYECAMPFAAMPLIRPDVGREIAFSVLIHDGDGTGLRDWGKASGLWPEQRNRFAWCQWESATWPAETPYDSKLEWGLCSSKH